MCYELGKKLFITLQSRLDEIYLRVKQLRNVAAAQSVLVIEK